MGLKPVEPVEPVKPVQPVQLVQRVLVPLSLNELIKELIS